MNICCSIENIGVTITRGGIVRGQPICTKVKGQDKEKIRLEDSRQFVRKRIQDITQQKLARKEMA